MNDRGDSAEISDLASTLRQQRRGRRLTQKQLSSDSGISLRTIQDLETGKTRAPQFHTLERLADVLATTELEREVLFRAGYPKSGSDEAGGVAREQNNTVAVLFDEDGGQAPPLSTRKLSSRLKASSIVLGAVIVCSLMLTLIVTLSSEGESPASVTSPAASCSIPPTPPAPKTPVRIGKAWRATVVNTWSLTRCEDLGVRPRVSPLKSKKLYPGFFTGTWVYVTCYYARGVVIADKDTHKSSTVWYKLQDESSWLSAMFLRLENEPGSSPPPGMPACRRVE